MSADFRTWPNVSEGGLLELARSLGVLSPLDQQFASRLSALYGERSAAVRWALAIASRQEAGGHVCADLRRLASEGLSIDLAGETETYSVLAASASVDAWIAELAASSLIEVVQHEDRDAKATATARPRPLVLDDRGRLYLRRSFESQRKLAALVRIRAHQADLGVDWTLAEAGIGRLVGPEMGEDTSTAQALRTALARPLAIVTGGPGTGKTTLVARLVSLLLEQALACGAVLPRVRLLAPTGKAAATMTSSFARHRTPLSLPPEVRDAMNVSAETVHRALHRQTRSNAIGRPELLSFSDDIVIVDEASMVDLELMTRLFEACSSVRRVVLLGDPAQLASVDAGAVLAELCRGNADDSEEAKEAAPLAAVVDFRARAFEAARDEASGGLRDSIVTLRTSHRFSAGGAIARLAEAIRAGDAERVIALLDDPMFPEVERFEVDRVDAVRERLIEASRDVHREIGEALTADLKLERMNLYRVLCAHRRGPLGVEALCSVLDEAAATERQTTRRSDWWLGRMLLVTHNAPDQDLWNGDVGLIEDTPSGLRALFSDGRGGVRALSAGRLPTHESAIAMSVHKSQGSEFDVVDLVLGDVSSRLMTRELLYTGVTRARSRLRIHASESVLRGAVQTRVSRDSGLAGLLWAD